jgi:hypothetical protein
MNGNVSISLISAFSNLFNCLPSLFFLCHQQFHRTRQKHAFLSQ